MKLKIFFVIICTVGGLIEGQGQKATPNDVMTLEKLGSFLLMLRQCECNNKIEEYGKNFKDDFFGHRCECCFNGACVCPMTPKVLSFQSKYLAGEGIIRAQKAALPFITEQYAYSG